ncbi:MAG: GTPase HflX [Spirochaetales bacterium]|nr:GTPase HflX [Spirochaetales bacterium]
MPLQGQRSPRSPLIKELQGNLNGLKPNQLDRLSRLSRRRIQGDLVVSQEFARELTALSSELHRQIGVLIDRQGRVQTVLVGDAHRIVIPALEKKAGRLRGIRLVHTHLFDEPLSEEDLYDLTLLRLDFITAITIDASGFPALFHHAHAIPGPPGYAKEKPGKPGQEIPFQQTIEELEAAFQRQGLESREVAARTRAFLVGVYTPAMRARRSPEESMAELRELCRTAGVVAAECFVQNRSALDPVTVAGSGKIKELTFKAVQANVDLMIFDCELTPAQARRISQLSELKIVDRTQLILDIFARNAHSRDGKLQVELAQLRYLKERLSEKDDNMSRLTGGIGGRGPGETKLEIGRRRVSDRIHRLEKELESLEKRRMLLRRRRSRSETPVVSIVGYTNAGKSTLLNALTESTVAAEDRLFATLDPTTRRLRFPEEREIILTDTVGFIHDLPPELRKAFYATLEELRDSSLLLHVIDASDPDSIHKKQVVEGILSELELGDLPIIHVYNKCDLLSSVPPDSGNSVTISAASRTNLQKLFTVLEGQVACLYQKKQPVS